MTTTATTNQPYLGMIEGKFTVDQNGSAVYSIPLQVPPGTHTMEPELSLVYHSALTNGLMGVGWSLHGLSAIKRVGLATRRAVVFSYESREDVEPRYEAGFAIHDTLRLKRVQTLVDGRALLTYTLDYQRARATRRSQLTRITLSDAEGRALTPTRFDWHDLSEVSFTEVEQLPDSDIPWGGRIVPLDVNGDGFRDLLVASADENQNLALKLLLARNDGTGFFPPVTLPPTGLPFGDNCELLPLDVNGDGSSDLVYVANHEGNLGLTLFTAVNDSGQWRLQQGKANGAGPANLPWGGYLVPMDINGDGRIDLVYCTADGSGNLSLRVLLSNGTGFEQKSETATPFYYDRQNQVLALDLNGDGMADLVYAYNDNSQLGLRYFLSNGTRLELQPDNPLPAGLALPFGGALMPHNVKDDGNEDLVYACADSGGNLLVYTLLSTGAGFKLASATPEPTGLHYTGTVLPVVVRGPGLTDLLVAAPDDNNQTTIQLLRCTGSGFVRPDGTTAAASALPWGGQLLPLDLRGTGKTDLLQVAPDDRMNMRFTRLLAPRAVPDRIRRLTNGLGAQFEITYKPITDPSVYSKAAGRPGGEVDPQGLFNGMVTGASWPLTPGPQLSASTTGATYTTASRQFAEYVVSNHAMRDGRGKIYQYRHTYAGARIDLTGHGWLGFATKQTVDADLDAITLEEYEQSFPLTYNLKAGSLCRSRDGSLLRRVTNQYAAPQAKPGVYRIQLRKATTEAFTSGKLDRTEVVAHEYDDYDNLIRTTNRNAAAPPLYTAIAYDETDLARWWFGREIARTVTADAEGRQLLTREQFVNDRQTGQRVETHLWEDQNRRWLVTRHQYDRFGNETMVTDATGAVTVTEYDETYRTFAVRKQLPANEAGVVLVLRSEYDPRFGVEKIRTDANGVRWFQESDGLGRVIETRGPAPDMNPVTLMKRRWGQDEQGVYEETQRLTEWGGAVWRWERQYRDGLGRDYRTASLGADGASQIIFDRSVNSKGLVLEESLPYFAGAAPKTIRRAYDAAGRLIREEQPIDGDGTRITETNYPHVDREVRTEAAGTPLARTTIKEYATYGDKRCLIKSIDGNGAVTVYEYDPLGRLTRATDPIGVTTTSGYDSLNRRIEVSVANAQKTFLRERVKYEDFSRIVMVRTNKGNEIVHRHDARSRLIERIVNTPGGEPAHTRYRYDVGEGRLAMDRLAEVTMPGDITYAYAYDAHGNTTRHAVTLGGQTHTLSKSYTPGQQVARLIYPDGASLTNRYTVSGQMAEMELAESESPSTAQRFAHFEEFTAFGMAQKVRYGNGATEAVSYNRLGQLKSQTVRGRDGSNLAATSFQWNALHALVRITDQIDPQRTESFAYDLAGRLSQAIRNAGAAPAEQINYDFAYDHAGNLKKKDGVSYTYEGHQMRRGEKGGAEIFRADYDADGAMQNVTRQGEADTYRYDGQGRLVATKETTFTYDHTGQRLIKQAAGVTTYYVAPDYEITRFANGGSQATKYILGPYGAIAQVTRSLSEGRPSADDLAGVPAVGVGYYHRNHINSTVLHLDAAGQVTARIDYLPFGEIYSISGRDAFRPKFTGKELDHETGLYYFKARYYDPRIGRFITSDDRLGGTFGTPDALNRYAYVLNNPITGVDPDGHFRWDIFADVMMGIAAVTLIGAATVLTGGAATPLIGLAGSAFLGAAMSGSIYSATHSGDNFSWNQWGVEVGIGAVSGVITGGSTGGAVGLGSAAAKRWAWSKLTQITATAIVGGAFGMGAQYVGKGIHNTLTKGKSWGDDWQTSLWQGVAKGFVGGGMGAFNKAAGDSG